MKPLPTLALLFTLIVFSAGSCECEDIQCDGFDINYSSWLNYNIGQTITFSDSISDINLTINNRSFSEPFTKVVEWKSGDGCDQYSDVCKSEAILRGQFTPALNGYTNYYVRVSSHRKAEILRTDIFLYDFSDGFIITPKIELEHSLQNYYPALNLNGKNYTDVVSMEIDTTNLSNLNKRIWKVYYNEIDGVIGFADRHTNSTYYLKP